MNLVTVTATTSIASTDRGGAVAPAKVRFAGVEWLRIVAVLHVLWVHTHPGAPHLGGPLALMAVAVAFAARAPRGASMTSVVRRRAARLLVPWVFWSVVYGFFVARRALASGGPWPSGFETWMVLTGPVIHLWFLPACFVYTVVVSLGAVRGWFTPRRPAWGVWCGLTAVAILGCAMMASSDPSRWLHYWNLALPAVLMGLALHGMPTRGRARVVGLLALAVVAAGAAAGAAATGHGALMPHYAVCGGAVARAWAWRRASGPVLRWMGDCILGVYLAHMAVWFTVLGIAHRFGWDPAPGMQFALVAAVSVALVAGMKATPMRRFV